MTSQTNLRWFEGRQVSIALRDGSRIDDCSLLSVGRNPLDTLWLFVNDEDVFVPRSQVIDVWESKGQRPRAA